MPVIQTKISDQILSFKNGAGSASGLQVESVKPSVGWLNTGAGANEKQWEQQVGGLALLIRSLDDAGSSARNVLSATRNAASYTLFRIEMGSGTETFAILSTGVFSVASLIGTSKRGLVADASGNITAPEPITLTDAATIAVDAALGGDPLIADVTLAGNRTLGAPTNPVNGRRMIIRVKQDGTGSRTLAYNAIYRFPASIPSPTLSTAANSMDILAFEYNTAATKWDCVSFIPGYT